MLALRHENRALLDGEYIALNENDQNVLAYVRRYKDENVLVALNMSGTSQKVSLDLSPAQLTSAKAETLLSTSRNKQNAGMAPLQLSRSASISRGYPSKPSKPLGRATVFHGRPPGCNAPHIAARFSFVTGGVTLQVF